MIDIIERYQGKQVQWKYYGIIIGLSVMLGVWTEWRIAYTTIKGLEAEKSRLEMDNKTLASEKNSLTAKEYSPREIIERSTWAGEQCER